AWRKAAASVYIPYEPDLRIHKQASQFTDHEHWDFAHTRADQYPLFLHFPYFDLYRKQVVKQADLVLAMHLRGDAFTAEEKARNLPAHARPAADVRSPRRTGSAWAGETAGAGDSAHQPAARAASARGPRAYAPLPFLTRWGRWPRRQAAGPNGGLRPYFSSAVAPASFRRATAFSASAFDTFSSTGFGAASTRSFASLRPSCVSSRTALITLILLSPTAVSVT